MFLRFEAQLNGRKFSEIAPELILRDIVESPAEMDVSTLRFAHRPGQRVSSMVRTSLSVRLVYVIRTQDIQRRMEIRDLIMEWAGNGGTLTLNTRPGKMLNVVCENGTALESSLRWAQDLSLSLTAYGFPYWCDAAETVKVVKSNSTNQGLSSYIGTIYMPGQRDTYVVASIHNNGNGAMTKLNITCDKTVMTLSGMSLPAGHVVRIYYDNDVLRIIDDTEAPAVSLLSFRTADSNDDLMLPAGVDSIIYVSADQAFDGTISARGVWL